MPLSIGPIVLPPLPIISPGNSDSQPNENASNGNPPSSSSDPSSESSPPESAPASPPTNSNSQGGMSDNPSNSSPPPNSNAGGTNSSNDISTNSQDQQQTPASSSPAQGRFNSASNFSSRQSNVSFERSSDQTDSDGLAEKIAYLNRRLESLQTGSNQPTPASNDAASIAGAGGVGNGDFFSGVHSLGQRIKSASAGVQFSVAHSLDNYLVRDLTKLADFSRTATQSSASRSREYEAAQSGGRLDIYG